MDKEINIIEEFNVALRDIIKACDVNDIDKIKDKVSFLIFLMGDLSDSRTGEFEHLRHRRFT